MGVSKIIPISYGIVPNGDRKLFDKYIRQIILYKIKNKNLRKNKNLTNAFKSEIELAFDEDTAAIINDYIPEEFFSSQENLGLPSRFYGTPYTFMQRGFIQILFHNRAINFHAIQHGGGYGEYRENLIETFEKKCCDKYYHWGLGENNVSPNAFRPIRRNFGSIQDTYYLGTIDYTHPILMLTKGRPSIYREAQEKRIDTIKKINEFSDPVYINHFKEKKITQHCKSMSLNQIHPDSFHESLFVIDVPGHTFFYKAVYQNIPILLFFSKKWDEYFTDNYIQLLEFLHSIQVLFYWEQEKDFLSCMDEILSNSCSNHYSNLQIVSYLENAN